MPIRTLEEEHAIWIDPKRITNTNIPGYTTKTICDMKIATVPTDYEPKDKDDTPCRVCINRQCLHSSGIVPIENIDKKNIETCKHPEEMPCGLSVGYDICITQENLFKYAVEKGYDIEDFITKYMQSDFCKRHMDALYSWLQTEFETMVMSYLLDEITPEKTDQQQDKNAFGWIGWMYRYLQLRLEISSKKIIEMLPLKDMLAYYKDMHTKEAEYFLTTVLDRLSEKQFTEEPVPANGKNL